MEVYRSNGTERLLAELDALLERPVGGPFEPEWIVVQSRGMATWLSMELARRQGVWAGGEFLFPRRFLERVYRAALGAEGGAAPSEAQLFWAVLAVLPDLLERPEMVRLRRYLGEDRRGVRRFQLAQRIARVFDQYALFRPEMVLAWEAGDDAGVRQQERWQPVLWRAIAARSPSGLAGRPERAREVLAAAGEVEGLPPRLSIFGIASLPPTYVRLLAALAGRVDVHVFLLSPCRQHWGDLLTPRQAERLRRRGGEREDLHLDSPNALLASLGALGAEFENILADELEAAGVAEREPAGDLHAAPPGDMVLGRLQADILDLRGPEREPEPAARRRRKEVPHPLLPFAVAAGRPRLAASDCSVQLHSCHGPMREVEVLHDQLLDLLTGVQGIAPRDVVVMMPDVDTYAPLIEAVFDRDPGDPASIPYRIADRTVRSESPAVDAFVRILDLVGGRAPASEVLDLLRLVPLQRKFGIEPGDLEQIARWVTESGVRWGMHGQHRSRHGQPELGVGTWRFGLERMLLGYAMPGDERETFAGVLSYDEIEGQDAVMLGRLAEYCERLFGWLERLEVPRPVPEWRDSLVALLDGMLAAEPSAAWEHERIRTALDALCEEAAAAGFDQAVDLVAMRSLIEPRIEAAHPERGFLSGGVTFCAFVPMRSVPFEVVCMMGMADGEFPRLQRPVDFDLCQRDRRPGDRSRRDDDRYLFLEALLSARQRLLITYTGQSIRDNSQLAPSVVVGELLDAITETFDPPGWSGGDDDERAAAVAEHVVVRHPLQPFSRRYFEAGGDARLFSYAEGFLRAAECAGERRRASVFVEPLAPEDAAEREVALDDLVRFFAAPIRQLLQRRLQVSLNERDLQVPDREAIELDGLETYAVGDRMLQLLLDGVSAERTLELERAQGALPPGTLGAVTHARLLRTVEKVLAEVARWRRGQPYVAPPVRLLLPCGTRLCGSLGELWDAGLVEHQFARVKAKNKLALWVRHLVLGALGVPEAARSVLIGRAPPMGKTRGPEREVMVWKLGPVDEPLRRLTELVALYREGLTAPLRLPVETAAAYWRALGGDPAKEAEALDRARAAWSGERQRDPHLRRVFGDAVPPFGDVFAAGEFAALARATVGLLEAHADVEWR